MFIHPIIREGRGEKTDAQTHRMCRNLMFECASKYINTKKKQKTLIWERFRFGPYGHERALCWFDYQRSLPETCTRKHSHTQTFPQRKAVFVLRCSAEENTLLTHLNKVLSLIFKCLQRQKVTRLRWKRTFLVSNDDLLSYKVDFTIFYIFQFKDCEPDLLYICRDACIFQPPWASEGANKGFISAS